MADPPAAETATRCDQPRARQDGTDLQPDLLYPALLTVLSVTPAFLLFCACELSPSCLARGFGNFLIGPGGVRKPAVVIMLAPLAVLLTNVVVFLRCHRRRDVLDFSEGVGWVERSDTHQ